MGIPARLWLCIALCSLVLFLTSTPCQGQRLRAASELAPAPAPLRSVTRPPKQAARSGVPRSAAAAGEPSPGPGRAAIARLAAVRPPAPHRPALPDAPIAPASAAAADAANAPAGAAEPAAAAAAPAAAASTLFVVCAKSATVTQLGRGRNASVVLEGVDPWATWFTDKPVHRGGRIMSSRFFGPEFQNNGSWMLFPNLALYSGGLTGTREPIDRVLIITVGSNPAYSNFSDSSSMLSSMSILSDGSVTFPAVTLGKRDIGKDTVAGYYSSVRGTFADVPTVVNGTAMGRSRNAVFSNVALFVETSLCGCSVLGTCGCHSANDAQTSV